MMIPLTKYLMIQAIAGLSHGDVPTPKENDYQLTVIFNNADDKHTFIENFQKVNPQYLKLVKCEHGLTAKVECLSYPIT